MVESLGKATKTIERDHRFKSWSFDIDQSTTRTDLRTRIARHCKEAYNKDQDQAKVHKCKGAGQKMAGCRTGRGIFDSHDDHTRELGRAKDLMPAAI